jgi:hypothetical protein
MTKDEDPGQRRMLIIQPKVRGSKLSGNLKEFDIIGTYPPHDPEKGIDDDKLNEMLRNRHEAGPHIHGASCPPSVG